MSAPLERVLREAKVIVSCGSGGVGKTTFSAALGLAAAARGRKVLVATVDPARRLADALGVDALSDEETRVPARLEGGGELWATMLDTQRTFDRLVRKHAPDPASSERILGNRIYRAMSRTVAGTQEFMAMERLFEIHARGAYDLVVLDTPPTVHALDFLTAPQRMEAMLESGVLAAFTRSTGQAGRWGMGLLVKGGELVMGAVGKVVGSEFLSEMSEFFQAFEGMYGGFQERAQEVRKLLAGEGTAFVLVTAPGRATLDEAREFADRLKESGLPLAAVVVNRVHTVPAVGSDPAAWKIPTPAAPEGDQVLADLIEAYRAAALAAAGDAARIAPLRARVRAPVVAVPLQDHEIHDIKGLGRLAGAMGL